MDFLQRLLGLGLTGLSSGIFGVTMTFWTFCMDFKESADSLLLLHGCASGAHMAFQQRLLGVSKDILDLLNGLSGLSAEVFGSLPRLSAWSFGTWTFWSFYADFLHRLSGVFLDFLGFLLGLAAITFSQESTMLGTPSPFRPSFVQPDSKMTCPHLA